ncbi:MAG: SH3 domain-containing protein [Clostridia bacterium]|nr:SH3 domain-containing protein [Clostridia bacterium]
MLPRNIFNINKIIGFLLILSILVALFTIFFEKKVEASYNSKFKNYPGYEELIKKLQEAHPNWEFEILETGLNWTEAIIAESTGHHGLNVVPKSWESAWKCGCSTKVDAGWACASTAAVAYYMDPRNSLNEDYIFQFEQLSYDAEVQTRTGVETILSDCNYMQGKITYYDTNGKKQTMNKTYIDVLIEAAKKYNISPLHLASRIRQEQGAGNAGTMISGTWTNNGVSYKGYYNYFNINAYGSTTEAILRSGLEHAKKQGWTNPEKSIMGGAEFLAREYVSYGQNTLYLQKFNVNDKNGNYYSYQYMTNVSASKSEGESVREAYRDMGMLTKESKIKFRIPVYKNMPEMKAARPGTEQIVTQDVQINNSNVIVRSGKGTNYSAITTLSKGTKILRIELDNSKDSNGRYWDKVVLNNGSKGYISREYLTALSLQSNCNEEYIVSAYTNFRNGPGTKGTISTTIIKLLSPGQRLTVVEKGKYESVDGESWYRVKLADGSYGYVGTGYIKPYNEVTDTVDKVIVVCTDGLNIRKEPSSKSTILKAVTEGTILTRTGKDVKSSDTKYTWDKVTTSSGTVGYVVREDPTTKKAWIEPYNNSGGNSNTGSPNTDFKLNGSNLISKPNITVATVKKQMKDAVIKKGSTTIADKDNIGTGYTITTGGKTYTIVVKGDANRRWKNIISRLCKSKKSNAKKSYFNKRARTSSRCNRRWKDIISRLCKN